MTNLPFINACLNGLATVLLLAGWVAYVRHTAQTRAERLHARTRRDALRLDRQLEQSMGFSGAPL